MIGPGWFEGVLGTRHLCMRWLVGRLASLRSERNGCPFLGPLGATRKPAISLELGWARVGSPPGLLEPFPEGTGIVGPASQSG